MQSAPVPDAALERPVHAIIGEGVRIAHLKVAQERDRLHRGIALEDRRVRVAMDRKPRPGRSTASCGRSCRSIGG